MIKQINFAIVGCGNIANRHAKAAAAFGKIVAVCDQNIDAANLLAETHQCKKTYATLTELLNQQTDIDVVCICTPNYLHASQSIECMKMGYHVICEKPMAINSADAAKMIEISSLYNKHLFIVKQLRHYPSLLFIKKLLEEKRIRNILSFEINCLWNRNRNYYRDWRGAKNTDGGTLYTQFSHHIDLVLWLFGAVSSFHLNSANVNHPYIEFEDCGQVELKMQSGIIGTLNYSVNALPGQNENSIELKGVNGGLKFSGPFLNQIDYFDIPNLERPLFDEPIITSESHYAIYREVVSALSGHPNTATSGNDSIQSIRLIEALYETQNEA